MKLIAGNGAARHFDGFGEPAAHRAQDKGGDLAFRGQRYAGGLSWKFGAAVELQPRVFEKLGRKAHVFGAVHTPEPQLLFLALEEIQGFFQPLHSTVKGPGEKEDAEVPGVAGIVHLQADAVLARLVPLDAAAIIVSNRGSAGSHVFTDPKVLRMAFLRKKFSRIRS